MSMSSDLVRSIARQRRPRTTIKGPSSGRVEDMRPQQQSQARNEANNPGLYPASLKPRPLRGREMNTTGLDYSKGRWANGKGQGVGVGRAEDTPAIRNASTTTSRTANRKGPQ
jgi:hypothetical protein